MKLWAGGKYLLTMPGQGPACSIVDGARTNNVRKLLITDSTLTNNIHFLYFPPFATTGPVPLLHNACFCAVTAQRQNLSICLALAARNQPARTGGNSHCTNAQESFPQNRFSEKVIHSKNQTKCSYRLKSVLAEGIPCISSPRYRCCQLLSWHKYLISLVGRLKPP